MIYALIIPKFVIYEVFFIEMGKRSMDRHYTKNYSGLCRTTFRLGAVLDIQWHFSLHERISQLLLISTAKV